MKTEIKYKIAAALEQHLKDTSKSYESAGNSMKMSAATISNIVNKKWEHNDQLVSEKMWNKVAAAIRFAEDWVIVRETRNFKRLQVMSHYCKQTSNARLVIGDPGASKSESFKMMAGEIKGVFRIECAEYWTKKVFLNKLRQAMGLQITPVGIPEIVEEIASELVKIAKPLVIIDEADKLKDGVLNLFNSLYNLTQGHCGFVLAGAPFLKVRIDKGVRLNKQSYKEIYSRCGGEYFHVKPLEEQDVNAICVANGITERLDMLRVWNQSHNDLRRVRREVEQIKLEQQKDNAERLKDAA